jgi:hypothetical protein
MQKDARGAKKKLKLQSARHGRFKEATEPNTTNMKGKSVVKFLGGTNENKLI